MWQDSGDITTKQAYHQRQSIEGLLTLDEGQELNQYIRELDDKVLEVSEYYK